MRKTHSSVRLFKSDFLELFTHVHPITPFVMWTPVIAYLTYRSFAVHEISILAFLGIGLLGLAVWSLTEYVLHRFVFHYPAKSTWGKRLVYILHGLHHEDPADPTRLVMPPLPAAVYATILFFIFKMIIGPAYVEPFMVFFLLGYLGYDYTHYYVHHFNPRGGIGKKIKAHHMVHHFATHDARWGVSSPLWDHVFGTLEEHPREKTGESEEKPAKARMV